MVVFYTLLNISNIKYYVLYLFCHTPQKKLNRRSFINNVAMQLIDDILKRIMQSIRLKKDLREGINRMLSAFQTPSQPYTSKEQRDVHSVPGHIIGRWKQCVTSVVNMRVKNTASYLSVALSVKVQYQVMNQSDEDVCQKQDLWLYIYIWFWFMVL